MGRPCPVGQRSQGRLQGCVLCALGLQWGCEARGAEGRWAGLPAGHQRGLEPWHNHWILSKGRQGLQVGVWTGARLSTQRLDPGAVTEPRTTGRRQFSQTNKMVRDENVQNVAVLDAGSGHTGAYVRRFMRHCDEDLRQDFRVNPVQLLVSSSARAHTCVRRPRPLLLSPHVRLWLCNRRWSSLLPAWRRPIGHPRPWAEGSGTSGSQDASP